MIRVTWRGEKTIQKVKGRVDTYLHAAGNLIVNQMVNNSHVITGTLRNSMNYKLQSGEGKGFSTTHGEGTPPSSAKVSSASRPEMVRAGSALVYAGPQERHNGWASKTYDQIRTPLKRLAARVFKI